MEVTDNNESSFKVTEESVAAKNHKQGHETAKVKPPSAIKSPHQSKPGLVHTTGNAKLHTGTSSVQVVSHNTNYQKISTKAMPLPVVNLAAQNNNFHVMGLPVRLHAHPDLPRPIVSDVSASLNRQKVSDLFGNKASNISHNSRAHEWGPFSKCSSTCGEGVRKRYRKCNVEECTAPGLETQVVPCTISTCSGMLNSFCDLKRLFPVDVAVFYGQQVSRLEIVIIENLSIDVANVKCFPFEASDANAHMHL